MNNISTYRIQQSKEYGFEVWNVILFLTDGRTEVRQTWSKAGAVTLLNNLLKGGK